MWPLDEHLLACAAAAALPLEAHWPGRGREPIYWFQGASRPNPGRRAHLGAPIRFAVAPYEPEVLPVEGAGLPDPNTPLPEAAPPVVDEVPGELTPPLDVR